MKKLLFIFSLVAAFFLMLEGCSKDNLASTINTTSPRPSTFNSNGVGGFNLDQIVDRVVPFDYYSNGQKNQFVAYRSGSGFCYIENNINPINYIPSYSTIFQSTSGIGGYDLMGPVNPSTSFGGDKMFAFDYDHSGKADHLVVYRPGIGAFWILKNTNGVFSPVYSNSSLGTLGIGGFNFDQLQDRACAFDYENSGKLDYLVVYRPGQGVCWILKNTNGVFSPVYSSSNLGVWGIGGYDLMQGPVANAAYVDDLGSDKIFPFDYDGTGHQNYLAIYRPGLKTFWIIKNNGGTFSPVYQSSNGLGGYNIDQQIDRAFAFDYDGTGYMDHVVLCRPGNGAFWIVKNNHNGTFSPVFQSSGGIGGYNFDQLVDQAFAFDFDGAGRQDHLVLYRPGAKAFWILRHSSLGFTQIY